MSLAEKLWELIQHARWFGGRARDGHLEHVRSLDPIGDVQSFLLDVRYSNGGLETYHVPISHSALPHLVEACDDGLLLWDALTSGAPGATMLANLPRPEKAMRFAGEQSNTNVFFTNGSMVKVLRRVEPGGGIEAELLAALRGESVAPELYGIWAEGDLALGALVETLKDPQDAYDIACEAARANTSFESEARTLGETLSTVHRLLAERLPSDTADAAKIASRFQERFDTAAVELPALEEFRCGAARIFAAVKEMKIHTQRVHGDCHLGQVLRTEGSWRYVDFEGEPMKTLAERRKLDSPLRDVAGMLRSFAYAASAGKAGTAWHDACREAFLAGYGVETDPVIVAYELDKAIYEALYEARFRPQLINVPFAALRALAAA